MFTKLEKRSWIKIEVARCRNTQKCFRGLREACGDIWWYRHPTSFMAMQGVTLLLLSETSGAAGNGRFWNIHRNHPIWIHAITIFSPKWKYHIGDPEQHKRWTYPCYRAVSTEHQQRWTRWWCTTPSKHIRQNMIRGTDSIEGQMLYGGRVIGISGSLIWSKTLLELIFKPCGEFRWRPKGPDSQIYSPLFHVGAPVIF